MKTRINFAVEENIKKRLNDVGKANGLGISEILRRAIIRELKELGGEDNHA